MDTREILIAAVVPLVVSAVVLGVLHGVLARRKKGGAAPTLAWIVPVLMAGAVVLGSWAWQSRVSLWAESVTHRFPAVAIAAMVAGLIASAGPIRWRPLLAAIPALVGGCFVAWAVLGKLHESLIGEAARWGWIAGVGVIAAAQAWAIETGARAMPGWRAPAVLWLLLGVIALGATSGLANAPLILWPASAVCFALAGVGVFRRETNLLPGVGATLAVLIVGVVAISHWFGDRERWLMFALLMASPLPLALAGALKGRPRVGMVAAGAAALGLAGAQAGMAVPELVKANSGSAYEYSMRDRGGEPGPLRFRQIPENPCASNGFDSTESVANSGEPWAQAHGVTGDRNSAGSRRVAAHAQHEHGVDHQRVNRLGCG